jgi:asparaginyl-tRNA synthetase
MDRERVKHVLAMEPANQPVTVAGWVRTKRDAKKHCFFEVNDGSCLANLQVFVDKEKLSIQETLNRANTGASVRVSGILVPSPGKQKQELAAQEVEVIGEADPATYPLQKKRHSFEFLREIAHLRPRTNTFGAVARIRSALSYAIHTFFTERDFYYVHTPIITASDAEGAGAMFQVTTLQPDQVPNAEGRPDYSEDFFGRPSFLTVSGQLEAEIYACALDRVYTFGPTFRAEHSTTTRHLAEFWMIEPEMAFCDLSCNMDLAEEFLKYVFAYVLEHCAEDMDLFNRWIEKGVADTLRAVVDSSFVHITYTEAIDELAKAEREFEFQPAWGSDLQAEHEKYLTEEVHNGPVIVTDYPKEIKAFYMKLNADEKTVRAMDVLVPRLGEIIGGSERESDLETLERRIRECDLPEEEYWWYLDLRRFGTVPHSGFGLGFERLLQYVTGMQNIRDVIPFPRALKSIGF